MAKNEQTLTNIRTVIVYLQITLKVAIVKPTMKPDASTKPVTQSGRQGSDDPKALA